MSSRVVEVGGNIAVADQMGRAHAAYAKHLKIAGASAGYQMNLYMKTQASNLSILFRILP
jgi:hypothetical protein